MTLHAGSNQYVVTITDNTILYIISPDTRYGRFVTMTLFNIQQIDDKKLADLK